MLEHLLAAQLRTVTLAGFTARGVSNIKMMRAYQPRQTATPSGPVVLFHRKDTPPFGWPARKDQWNDTTQQFDSVTRTPKLTVYQIAALVPQSPADDTQLSEADIVTMARDTLQHESAINAFIAAQIGILQPGQIYQTYFVDDKNQFEAHPAFDIILRHVDEFTVQTPAITEYDNAMYRT